MHGIRREDIYKTPEEEKAFAAKLEKGFKLLDSFVANVRESEASEASPAPTLHDAAEADRMFELSTAIIDFMPEFYPSWHYRKNYLVRPCVEKEQLRALLDAELPFTESVLKKSPKCYAVWHHRLWILTLLFNLGYDDVGDILNKEFALCMQFFRLDGRNFHGWGHVNYVRHYLKLLESEQPPASPSLVDKLSHAEFGKLIEKNFSNYSAWFHRGMLSETCGCLAEDLNSLTPAIYTDPNDQCLWHQFDWLLYRRNALQHYLVQCHFFKESHSFVFYFNDCVALSAANSFITLVAAEGRLPKLEGKWTPVSSAPRNTNRLRNVPVPEYAWRFTLAQPFDMAASNRVTVSLVIETDEHIIASYYSHMRHLPKCTRDSTFREVKDPQPCLLSLRYQLQVSSNGDMPVDLDSLQFMRNNPAAASGWEDLAGVLRGPVAMPNSSRIASLGNDITSAVLEQQLDMINELLNTGTESKYLHLASHKIRRHLGQPSDSHECYEHVKRIDSLRSRLYDDTLILEKVQTALDANAATGATSVDLSGFGLRRLTYRTLAPHVLLESLDLSDNALCDSSLLDIGLCLMLNLRHLSLARNGFTRLSSVLEALRNLARLERLDLSGNPCVSGDAWACTSAPEKLREIDVTNTPLAAFLKEEYGNTVPNACDSSAFPAIPGFQVIFSGRETEEDRGVQPSRRNENVLRVVLRRAERQAL